LKTVQSRSMWAN